MFCISTLIDVYDEFILYIDVLNKYIYRNNKTIYDLFEYARTICDGLPSNEDIYRLFDTKKKDKGLFGKIIEYTLFGQAPNSKSTSDLINIGYDIKSCAFKKIKNGKNAKERQTLTNCGDTKNYDSFQNIIENEHYKDCKYYKKSKRFVLFIRDADKCKYTTMDQLLNTTLLIIINFNLETLPTEMKDTINNDYSLIRKCILEQKVSQKGQTYLHIHPHGQGHGSGTRALGFTPKFITNIVGIQLSEMYKKSIKDIIIQKGNSITIHNEYL